MKIDDATRSLTDAGSVCFDTEFLRERTYHPLLCLAQILVGDQTLIIDPLTDANYDEFWPTLLATPLTLHSGRQDLEVLNISTGQLPSQVFDTQIAAGLTGMPPQIGYAALVERICNVTLDKAHTRTDWSRRPLASAVLDYAADDVRYLPAIEDWLREKLAEQGRLEWAAQDNHDLLQPDLYQVDTSEAWRRVKGIGRLPEGAQQIVCALADWREQTAQTRNLPRQWVARDDLLIELALQAPNSVDALSQISGANPKFTDRFGATIIGVMAGELPPPPPSFGRPDDAERKRLKAMAAAVREIAAELGVEAEILAPQRELKQAARGDSNIRALRGWRASVVSDAIVGLMP